MNDPVVKIGERLELVATKIFNLWQSHKVGILGTIVIQLLMAILFLSLEIKSRPYLIETQVQLDFQREYDITPPQVEPEKKELLLPADALNPNLETENIRNFAVDATKEDLNPGLSDDKGIDADELYQEAERLKSQMGSNKEKYNESRNLDEAAIPNTPEKNTASASKTQFKGPSVISYFLDGRRALELPVPSYLCEKGGQVVVDIEVNRNGRVTSAQVDKANSVNDDCITSAAISAALTSRFTAKADAPSKQKGSITYLFVPQ
ncbi:MAG: energy transducer TonB [Bacteroidales bacterium]|nr:energy transducer TonB [Bacteroidales bacterium]MBN2749401.1 energy transducer TonB [Bacteroidales bacterium]